MRRGHFGERWNVNRYLEMTMRKTILTMVAVWAIGGTATGIMIAQAQPAPPGVYPPGSPPPPPPYAQQPSPPPGGAATSAENCGTPDDPKPCPPLPRHPLPYYPANKQ